jgi:serine/threonine protein kinase/tetratricopeptide (TPR) repeat protein
MNRSMTVVASDPLDWARSGSLAPGEILAGRYRISAFLGRGAVGEVYEAFDQELGDAVAIKILRPEIARDERVLQRFKREIQLARRVTHPNVCRVFDLVHHLSSQTGEAAPGSPSDQVFLTMELLRGETLEQLLARQGRMSTAEALPVIGHIVAALAAAHANGVVHRDLKSGNIFLVPEPSGTRAVVTDFGLAWSSIEANDSASLTATGELVGSPAYMAPEQVRGEESTTATDIYALGVVLFEMVTGELPFVGKSAFYTALKRLQEPAPSPRLHLSDLDPAWEKTILRCLEREPGKRFPSVRHVLRALGLTKAEEDATSPLCLVESRVRRLRRRRRLAVELGAVLVVLAGCGLLWAWQTGHLGRHVGPASNNLNKPAPAVVMRPLVAVLPFDSLTSGAEDPQSRVFFELLPLELAASGKVRAVPAAEVDEALRDLRGADVARSESQLRRRFGADFLVTGAHRSGAAGTHWEVVLRDRTGGTVKALSAEGDAALESLAGDLRQAMGVDVLAPVEAQALDILRPEPGAALLWADALRKLRRGEAPAARDLLRRAVASDADNPLLHSALAESWMDLGHFAEARQEAYRAFTLGASLRREDRLALEARYYELGQDWTEAAARWRQIAMVWPDDLEAGLRQVESELAADQPANAAATLARLRGMPPPAGADPRLDLAEVEADLARHNFVAAHIAAHRVAEALGDGRMAAQARLEEATACLALHDLAGARQSVASAQHWFSAAGDGRGSADADRIFARIQFAAGDLSATRAAYAAAESTYRRLGADGEAAQVLREAGNVHNSIHDLDRAEAYYRQARILAAEVGDHRSEAAILHNLAYIFLQRRQLSAAENLFRQTLRLHREIGFAFGEAATLQGLANIAVKRGNLLAARHDFTQALEIYKRQSGLASNAAEALNNLADVSFELSDLARSRREREEARTLAAGARQEDGVARADRGIADVLRQQGATGDALALYERSLATYQRLNLPGKQAEILDEIGVALTLQGDLLDALKRFQQALAVTRERQDRTAEAEVLLHQGRALARWSEMGQASIALETALKLSRELHEPTLQAEALVALGDVRRAGGDLTAAQGDYQTALEIFRRRANRSGLASALVGLGSLQVARRQLGAARKSLEEALNLRDEIGEKLAAAESRLALAEVALAQKQENLATDAAHTAVSTFHSLANPPGECAATLLLARSLLAQGKISDARDLLAVAAPLLDASQEPAVRKNAAELRVRLGGPAPS